MCVERYVVLQQAVLGTEFADLAAAEANASAAVDKDRGTRVVVKVVSVIRPRMEPNVEIERVQESGDA